MQTDRDIPRAHSGSVLQLIKMIRQAIAFTVPFWNHSLNGRLGYGLGFGVEGIIMLAFSLCCILVL